MNIMPYVDLIIPSPVADLLVSACEATGLRWGVMSRKDYFFQPPKLHIVMFVAALGVVAVLQRKSAGYRQESLLRLGARGAGWSTKCHINTALAAILIGCFATQVYSKGSRPKPLVQLGWLLMPCHMMTLAWIYVLLRQKPQQYANNCYIATLLIDWVWNPIGALASPDWGDHQFAYEGRIFQVHHALLVLLPIYYACRYHTEELSKAHVLHLTWLPVLLNFAIKTPIAMFLGLNVDYMLSPPPAKGLPPVFHSVYYRAAFVPTLVVMACVCNFGIHGIAKAVAAVTHGAKKVKRKS